jgi:hypothetical protein
MGVTRVQYRERQRLLAADLRFEQAYRLGMAGRHYLGPHDWGVIRGLWVIQAGEKGFQLTPGVAIDGYGRELLVPETVDLGDRELDAQRCWYVHLFYCEDPEQVPPWRLCKATPAPRIRQRTAIRISETLLSPPADASDLASARAAGIVSASSPWPVLVARIGTGCWVPPKPDAPLIDHSLVRYAAHRSSGIRSPSGNATLQLGLTGLTDVYHFLVSTRDADQSLSRRLGVDRDQTFHVWRPLVISGAQGHGEIDLGKSLKLQIRLPMPAGLGRSLRIEGRVDSELRTLSASVLELGDTPPGIPSSVAEEIALNKKSVSLPFKGVGQASVSLLDANNARPIGFADARKRVRVAHKDADGVTFALDITRTGGQLALDNKAILRPAAQLDADPLMREIHAVITSAPADVALKTELRISGGAADDTDSSRRISFGAQTADGYVPSMTLDGRGRIGILASEVPAPGQEVPLLNVAGTVYLPPIGKSDPLLPDLVTLAYLSGLVQIGNIATNPKLQINPGTGSPASLYDLVVTRAGGNFTIKHVVELITGISSNADMSFRTLGTIDMPAAAAGASTTTHVTPPGLPPSSGRSVLVQALMLVEIGGKARVAISNSQPITLP